MAYNICRNCGKIGKADEEVFIIQKVSNESTQVLNTDILCSFCIEQYDKEWTESFVKEVKK